ncbi:MAG: glycoside hydrolase family 3 C-terminal domain-containing protein [candidate division KSB1 bacterium]|nr:glycoside hydrolase family 3 C-terminal domain-containing protein [candidate division KSB1 bacterium]MDZ7317875.1 glycoside hydrolase family 3 C-terminal domain-containing protein [candidate division KSB1 bacterium]
MEIYRDPSRTIDERVADLLSRMTLDEKMAQLQSVWGYDLMKNRERFAPEKAKKLLKHGMGQVTRPAGGTDFEPYPVAKLVNEIQRFLLQETRLGIPAMFHEECLSGWQARGATIFPQSIGIASIWDPDLIKTMTSAIRLQLKTINAHQGLAPVLDVARDPRWGRIEETFGEDPYLVAAIGKAYIEGLQGDDPTKGVAATVKHFVGYGVPQGGLNWAPAQIAPRELREVFLFPFEVAVRDAQVMAVMNAYHEIDGIPCAASQSLLTDILRREWGFEGIVVSDYEAITELQRYHHMAATKVDAGRLALEAGIDMELPQADCYHEGLKTLFRNGSLSEKLLDRAVARVLRLKFKLGLFEQPYVAVESQPRTVESAVHRKLALEIAKKSMVLLKNEGDLLPLNKKSLQKIAVIGPNANSWRNLLGDYSYPSLVEFREALRQQQKRNKIDASILAQLPNPTVPVVTVLEGIRAAVPDRTEVLFAPGCDLLDPSEAGFEEAIKIASEAEVAIVAVGGKSGFVPGCTSGEERDRADLRLPGVQQKLIEAIYNTGTPVVLVLVGGGPFAIDWAARHIPAIIEAWLPGEEGGHALADVLFGDYNPGGKLPITFPSSVGQVPVFYRHKPSAARSHLWEEYSDATTKPLYPFGHGLSYTQFKYSRLKIKPEQVPIAGKVVIEFDLENRGKVKGEEVVQLYLRDVLASVTRPVKELKGFQRIALSPKEKRRLRFELSTDLLAFYDQEMKLAIEPGEVEVMIGSSAEDIRLQGTFCVVGEKRYLSGQRQYFSAVTIQ